MPQLSTPLKHFRSFIGTDGYWLGVGLLLFFFAAPHTSSEGYFQTGKLFALAVITLLTATHLWINRGTLRFSAPPPVIWLAAGYLIWMTVTNTLTSSQPSYTLIGWPGWRGGLLTNALYWLLFVLVLWRPKESGDASRWRPALLAFLTLVSVWSTLEFLGVRPVLGNPKLGAIQGNFNVTAFPILTVGNTGWISGVWLLLTPLALIFGRRGNWGALLVTIALLLLGIASTQGNLSALVFSGMMLVFAGLTVRRSWAAALILAVSALLPPTVTAGLVALNEELQERKIISENHQDNQFTEGATSQTTSERLLIFTSALRSAAERPLTGWGYETFHNNFYSHLSPQEREPILRKIISAEPDEQVGMSGLAVIAEKQVDGQTVTREQTLLMVKPHNYLIEEIYSNGFTALLFLIPLLGLSIWELLRARTELALYALFALLGYGGYLMGWFLNPSVTPLALILVALGLRSADRQRTAPTRP